MAIRAAYRSTLSDVPLVKKKKVPVVKKEKKLKISDELVKQIRVEHERQCYTPKMLSQKYNLDITYITSLVNYIIRNSPEATPQYK